MVRKFFLHNGQFYITTVPALLVTVLGSCVAVCLWDKKSKVGGMNHYLMPGADEDNAGNADRGYNAIKMLIRSLVNRGVSKENIEAKIFGGCNSLYANDRFNIGKRNVETALHTLKEFDISVVASDTGGTLGRKIIFNTGTGKVKMRMLRKTGNEINEEINKGFGY